MIYNTSFLGMDPIWWIVFLIIIVWIFVVPFDIPGQRNRKDAPLEILKKRFASGDMTAEEFKRDSALLKADPGNKPYKKKLDANG